MAETKTSWFDRLSRAADALVEVVSPRAAGRRMAARAVLNRSRSRRSSARDEARNYEGAEHERLRGDRWLTSRLSPDSELALDLVDLRDRSRDLCKNDSIGGAVDGRVAHVVGNGHRPLATVKARAGLLTEEQAAAFNDAAEALFERWSAAAAADRVQSLWQIESLVERTVATDGECFVVFSDLADADSPIPLALEVVATDRVETPEAQQANPRIRLGIEYDAGGKRPVAYWIRDSHPGEQLGPAKLSFTRYEAWRVCHVFERMAPEQTRGLPWLCRGLNRSRDAKDLDEAMVISAQVEACYSAFVKKTGMTAEEAAAGAASETRSNGSRLQDLEPGTVKYLEADEDVVFANPTKPGNGFAPFQEWNYRRIAAGMNYPYEFLVKNWSGVSFAGGRLVLAEARLQFGRWQRLLRELLLARVWRRMIVEGVVTGELPIDARTYRLAPHVFERHQWIPSAWPYSITPKEEVDADMAAIEGNLKSKREAVAARGGEISEVYAEREWERRQEARLGIVPAMPGATAPAPAAGGGEPTGDETSHEPEPAEVSA